MKMMQQSAMAIACAVLLLACGGSDPVEQTPDSGQACAGCFASGECHPGDADDFCGEGGDTCEVCGAEQTCESGGCVAVVPSDCNETNCDGCCDGDVCLSGASGSACGAGGAACADCGPRGICEAVAQTCEVDPASRWNLIAVRATVPETNAEGGTWDAAGGLPDCYARGELEGAVIAQTRVIDNTLLPTWNEAVASAVRATDIPAVVVEILDSDANPDDSVGRCRLPEFSFAAFDGSERKLTCPQGAGWELIMILEPM